MARAETSQSTKKARGDKPAKPYPDFPLFPHATGRWAKKIRGKLHYFGPWRDWRAAVEEYQRVREDLYAGLTPRPKIDGITVADLVNEFLNDKRHQVDTKELVERTLHDYIVVCKRVAKVFGKNRLVADLAADDFDRLRRDFAKTRGLVALTNDMTRVRVLFNFGVDKKMAPELDYRRLIRKPKVQAVRRDRQARGKKILTPDELRSIVDAVPQPMKAMVLLGINCGFGNQDVALLTQSAIDLKAGWVEFPRPKTGQPRRAKLWPETVKSIREAINERPRHKDGALADRAFVTAAGSGWEARIKKTTQAKAKTESYEDNPVAKRFAQTLRAMAFPRTGVGFYTLRRMFETVGGGTQDQVAVDFVMGHAAGQSDMGSVYRQYIEDERLVALAAHVRKWLWPPAKKRSPSVKKSAGSEVA